MDLNKKFVFNLSRVSIAPSGRFVFKNSATARAPLQSGDEHYAARNTNAVNDNNRRLTVIDGGKVNNIQAEMNGALQISDDVRANIERWDVNNRGVLNRILDVRVEEAVKRQFAAERTQALDRMGFFERQFTRLGGAARNLFAVPITGMRRLYGMAGGGGAHANTRSFYNDAVGREMERVYGNGHAEQKRLQLAETVLNGLTNAQQDEVRDYLDANGVAIAVMPGTPAQRVEQLAEAGAALLRQMREDLSVPRGTVFPDPLADQYPLYARPVNDTADMYVNPAVDGQHIANFTAIDRLIGYADIVARERKKATSTTLYDEQRLHHFLDQMQAASQPCWNLLNEILEHDQLFQLRDNPEALALVNYLESLVISRNNNWAFLEAELRTIQTNQPNKKKKKDGEHGHGHDEEHDKDNDPEVKIKKVKENLEKLGVRQKALEKAYGKTGNLGNDLNAAIYNHETASAAYSAGTLHTRDAATYVNGLGARRDALTAKKDLLRDEVNELESNFKDEYEELMDAVNDFGTIPAGAAQLLALQGANIANEANSTEDQLFGVATGGGALGTTATWGNRTPSSMETKVLAFNKRNRKDIAKEIKDHFEKVHKPKEKYTCRQLLYVMLREEMEGNRVTGPEDSRVKALMAADDMIEMARAVDIHRSTNTEISEQLGGTVLGSNTLYSITNWVKKKTNMGGVYEAKDVIAFSVGNDEELKMFNDINPAGMSLDQLRDRVLNRISVRKLRGLSVRMEQTLRSFETLATEDKIKFSDSDAHTMELFIENLRALTREIRTKEIRDEARKSHGNKHEAWLDLIKKDSVSANNDETALVNDIAAEDSDLRLLANKKKMKSKMLTRLRDARRNALKDGLSRKELHDKLQREGLLGFFRMLKGALAAKEIFDVSVAGSRLIGNGLVRGVAGTRDAAAYVGKRTVVPVARGVKNAVMTVAGIGLGIALFPFKLLKKIGAGITGKGGGSHGGGSHAGGSHGGHH